MADREKVIKGLEECMTASCRGYRPRLLCPYNDEEWDIMRDALALLKEQEPVAPVMVPHSRGIAYNCGACGTEIAVIRDTVSADWQKNSVRYCRMCGGRIKW